MRPPRARSVLSVLAAGLVVLAGCAGGQPQPRSYGEVNTNNEGYYGNFMYGCTGVRADADGEYTDWTLSSPEFCTCVFEGLRDTVPFGDVQAFEEAQADAEDDTEITLPGGIEAVRRECAGEAGPA